MTDWISEGTSLFGIPRNIRASMSQVYTLYDMGMASSGKVGDWSFALWSPGNLRPPEPRESEILWGVLEQIGG